MIINFLLATICLPLITVETGEVVTATQLELLLMQSLNEVSNEVTETDLMTENCYEITITEN